MLQRVKNACELLPVHLLLDLLSRLTLFLRLHGLALLTVAAAKGGLLRLLLTHLFELSQRVDYILRLQVEEGWVNFLFILFSTVSVSDILSITSLALDLASSSQHISEIFLCQIGNLL